jgi:hypothetical protein
MVIPFFPRTLGLALALAASAVSARAQEPASREAHIAAAQAEKAEHLAPEHKNFVERRFLALEGSGGFGAVRPFTVAFGGIKSGSGFALGPAFGHQFSGGSFLQAKAVYSIRNFKLLQLLHHYEPFGSDRFVINTRGRWQDAPLLPFYGLGSDSTRSPRADYSEEKTEVSTQALMQPVSFLRFGAGTGYERFTLGKSNSVRSSISELFPPSRAPGVDTTTNFVHSFARAAIDTRTSPGYSRSGTLLEATLHDYRDRSDGRYSFQRTEAVVQQLIPLLHGNWVIDLSARAWSTETSAGHEVPFFLMPELGGSRLLRGYSNYRFRDRHALLLAAEYRWYVQEYVDGVLFYEAGKVASRREDLDLDGLKNSYGGGLNFHTPGSTVLRLQLARSREGLHFIIGFNFGL